MQDEKLSVWLGFLAAGNILSLILILGTIYHITTKTTAGPDGKPLPKEITTKVPEALEVKNDTELSEGAKSGIYSLKITDTGFKPEGLNALASENLEIEVANNGSDPYAFEMKSLGIKATTIDPGETKTFSVQSPADIRQETGFAYKATAAGSGKTIEGVLIFTKKQ
ncbi:MAG: cupredoxin domain-containing protein [Candidatus Pacebacteria bacterium]|jgi:hypothetical protein|nr:cupredoxin domain-containing protein [Candidatus Paceibacterota bacterium]